MLSLKYLRKNFVSQWVCLVAFCFALLLIPARGEGTQTPICSTLEDKIIAMIDEDIRELDQTLNDQNLDHEKADYEKAKKKKEKLSEFKAEVKEAHKKIQEALETHKEIGDKCCQSTLEAVQKSCPSTKSFITGAFEVLGGVNDLSILCASARNEYQKPLADYNHAISQCKGALGGVESLSNKKSSAITKLKKTAQDLKLPSVQKLINICNMGLQGVSDKWVTNLKGGGEMGLVGEYTEMQAHYAVNKEKANECEKAAGKASGTVSQIYNKYKEYKNKKGSRAPASPLPGLGLVDFLSRDTALSDRDDDDDLDDDDFFEEGAFGSAPPGEKPTTDGSSGSAPVASAGLPKGAGNKSPDHQRKTSNGESILFGEQKLKGYSVGTVGGSGGGSQGHRRLAYKTKKKGRAPFSLKKYLPGNKNKRARLAGIGPAHESIWKKVHNVFSKTNVLP